jgi:hypothetical protein
MRKRRNSAIFCALIAGGLPGCTIENWFDDPDEEIVPVNWITETEFQAPFPQVDVLWVVDNTQSMALEHAALENAFSGFVQVLDTEELGYQIGVVTTDMVNDGGVLRGNPWIITPSLEDSALAFANAINVGLDSTAKEAGLAAMVSALSEPLRSGYNRGFRRESAALHVIVVSDSNDHSEDWLGEFPLSTAENFLRAEEERTLLPAVFSAVVGNSPNGCSGASGTATPGARYVDLANRSGGGFASICESNLEGVLSSFGALSVVYPRRFLLDNPANEDSLRVSVNNAVRFDWTYGDSPPNVLFDTPPKADAKVQIRYQLAVSP